MDDRQRLEAIVSVINKYLPPDGTPINDAMSEIISLVDPLPAPQPAQEPERDMPHGWVVNWPSPNGGTKPVYHASAIKPKFGEELDGKLTMYPVFTRTAPPQREWNAALDEAAARIGEIKGFGQATQDSFAVYIKGLKK